MALALATVASAQQQPAPPPIGVPHVALGNGPFVFDTAEQHKIRVVVVTKGLSHPWSLAFLPGGNMLVTERAGRLRMVRDGVLDPQPLSGLPKVHAVRNAGLFDIVLHPKFAENKLLYFTYSKPGEDGKRCYYARARSAGGRRAYQRPGSVCLRMEHRSRRIAHRLRS